MGNAQILLSHALCKSKKRRAVVAAVPVPYVFSRAFVSLTCHDLGGSDLWN